MNFESGLFKFLSLQGVFKLKSAMPIDIDCRIKKLSEYFCLIINDTKIALKTVYYKVHLYF